jgi:hypothetical protein
MNKHIKVELDFIPVEEQLPEGTKTVWGLLRSFPSIHQVSRAITVGRGWWDKDTGSHLGEGVVTHWAEIPKIEAPQEG